MNAHAIASVPYSLSVYQDVLIEPAKNPQDIIIEAWIDRIRRKYILPLVLCKSIAGLRARIWLSTPPFLTESSLLVALAIPRVPALVKEREFSIAKSTDERYENAQIKVENLGERFDQDTLDNLDFIAFTASRITLNSWSLIKSLQSSKRPHPQQVSLKHSMMSLHTGARFDLLSNAALALLDDTTLPIDASIYRKLVRMAAGAGREHITTLAQAGTWVVG